MLASRLTELTHVVKDFAITLRITALEPRLLDQGALTTVLLRSWRQGRVAPRVITTAMNAQYGAHGSNTKLIVDGAG
jgi:hypothetical protein